ncbi:MAG: type II toxin-antitoxin system VapB family antitoxin [Gemmatimonadota bacterium]|nr:type II toxin-antitoxin system VapB family antitoxin [Gemmatimonadota bacterium]
MALNIKNPEAHVLAHRLAEKTGESLTTAVTEAIRTRLEELDHPGSVEAVLAAVAEVQEFVSRLPSRDTRPADEILRYDEFGLPD